MSSEQSYEVVRRIGVISGKPGGNTKEVNVVRWGKGKPALDIRKWIGGKPGKGIVIRPDEMDAFLRLMENFVFEE